MRNFMEAYMAVHNTEAKEELTSARDLISEMDLSHLTDSDLSEIVESVLEEMFEKGYSVDSAHRIFSEMFVESNIVGRQAKIERICEALNKAFDLIDSKASTVAMEEFSKYRHNKKIQESWSARFNQEKRVERAHNQLVARESLNVKTLLLQLVEKADKSYLETDMKKRQANNEKARKDMEKMGTSMKNPHFEEVSQIRKGWGDAYRSIYEKKADKDYDGDGEVESGTDEYMGSRDKAIKKAMGKKGKKCEEFDGGKEPNAFSRFGESTVVHKMGGVVMGKTHTNDGKNTVQVDDAPTTKKTYDFVKKKGLNTVDSSGKPTADTTYDERKAAGLKTVKNVNEKMDEGFELDQMIESLVERGHTEQEAYALVAQFTLDEAITSEKGKAKAAEMIAKRSTPSGRAKSGQGASVAQIKHISRANVDNLGGTPPNPKIAKNPVKSRSYGGTGNKAARRAGLTPTREKPNAWKEEFVDEAQEARNNPEKYEREQAKKSAPVRGERTPMPPRGDKRREDFEKWYATQMGR